MKKSFLIALIALPLTSEAVCFKAFNESGYGINMTKAKANLTDIADKRCGADDYNWSQIASEVTYTDAPENSEFPIKASALVRCCTAW